MRNHSARRALLLPTLLSMLAVASSAKAQSDEVRAGARAAAASGLKAFEQGRWSECVDLFGRAETLVHAPPHLLYIARCHAKLGHLVRAREAYLKIKLETIGPEKPKPFRAAQVDAEREILTIEPRIAQLNVKVTGAPAGATIEATMDGAAIPAALLGLARPVDPGTHEIVVRVVGYHAAPSRVTLADGQSSDVTIALVADAAPVVTSPPPKPVEPTIPPPKPVEPTTPPVTPAVTPPVTTTSRPPSGDSKPASTTSSKDGSGLRTAGWVTAGVGVAAVVVGGVFIGLGLSNSSDADNKYNQYNCLTYCTPAQQHEVTNLDSQAASNKTLGWIIGSVGLGAVGAGVAMIVIGGPKDESAAPKHGLAVEPWIGLGGAGLRGSF